MECSKKNGKNYPKTVFNREIYKPRLKFNPGLAPIGLRTTGPWSRGLGSKRSVGQCVVFLREAFYPHIASFHAGV